MHKRPTCKELADQLWQLEPIIQDQRLPIYTRKEQNSLKNITKIYSGQSNKNFCLQNLYRVFLGVLEG